MSADPARAPSVDQLVEVHQALWGFLEACHGTRQSTTEQEKAVLPRFERLGDDLAPIRPQIDSIEGWPTKIRALFRGIVSAFDEVTRRWGWEWIEKPKSERSTYLIDRRATLDRTLDEPILEAALFLADRWAAAGQCPYDDLADQARDRGLVPRNMTNVEALTQFQEARVRFVGGPRFGKCSPKIDETEYLTLCEHWQTLRAVLTSIVPDRVERPPWQEQQPASGTATVHESKVCLTWTLTRSDVALSMHDRNRPFPEQLDLFMMAIGHIEAWYSDTQTQKAASHCEECRAKFHRFLEVYTSRLVATPGFERLLLIAQREFGADLDSSTLRRIRGRIGRGDLTLNESADLFETVSCPSANPATPIPADHHRSVAPPLAAPAEIAAPPARGRERAR